MILRFWRGWTTPENADRYEELIAMAIFPGILARTIPGLEGLELFRRAVEAEVEFMTLTRFASWEAVKTFAGPNWEVSVVPSAARAGARPLRGTGDALRAAGPRGSRGVTVPRHQEQILSGADGR